MPENEKQSWASHERGRRIRENEFFVDVTNVWLVRHYPNSFGLTILKKLPEDNL